jgi:parvulin-like peptidyl-prolyl isomerase
VSPVFETPTAYYMTELVSKVDEGVPELAQVSAEIERILKLEKKIELAKPQARTLLQRLRNGETMDAVARGAQLSPSNAGPFTRLEFVPGMGRANAAVGAAFGMKPGQLSDVIESENMLYIIQLIDKKEADRQEFEAQKQQQRERTTPARAEQRWNMFIAALREDAEIIDNRAALQRQAAQQPVQQPY